MKINKVIHSSVCALSAVLLLAGCGGAQAGSAQISAPAVMPSAQATMRTDTADKLLAGDYIVNSELTGAALPGADSQALIDAIGGIKGASYDPLFLLGTQVVSGTNYAVLCRKTMDSGAVSLTVLTINVPPNGGALVCGAVPFDLADVISVQPEGSAEPALVSAYQTNTEFKAQPTGDKYTGAEVVFAEALPEAEAETGAKYEFAAELGAQTTSGSINHAFLALKNADMPGDERWVIMTVSESADAVIPSATNEIDISAYAR